MVVQHTYNVSIVYIHHCIARANVWDFTLSYIIRFYIFVNMVAAKWQKKFFFLQLSPFIVQKVVVYRIYVVIALCHALICSKKTLSRIVKL